MSDFDAVGERGHSRGEGAAPGWAAQETGSQRRRQRCASVAALATEWRRLDGGKIMSKSNEVSTNNHGTSVHELTDAELLEVTGATGGKSDPSSISFLHLYDKATPII
jgi:hypothetical protein